MTIKKIFILSITILISSGVFAGGSDIDSTIKKIFVRDGKYGSGDVSVPFNRFKAGVMVGTDIGGAIPVPMRYIPETFNPYPQLNLSLGLFGEVNLTSKWDVGFNVNYKTVGMKADARVQDQKYHDVSIGLLQYFTGTADMDMSFTMIEIPIYARYTFKNERSSILFGGYYAHNLKASFSTLATKGYAGGKPGIVEVVISEGGTPINMDFNSSLGNHDAGAMIGYEHNFMSRLDVGLRLTMGFIDIFKRGEQYDFFDYDMLNMRGSVTVRYRIFN